jgi:lysophospholipase L1-like esterase
VAAQLRGRLPPGCLVTLAAVDGAVTSDVPRQLDRSPPDADHIVVSVGGNDALLHEHVLGEPVRSVAEALALLAAVRQRFQQEYRRMLDLVLARALPTTVCTIYDPRFADPVRQRLAVLGLTIFNDVIAREAFTRGLPLIDLRLVCSRDEDFANPIEPSVRGGGKIAAAIADALAAPEAARGRSQVFVGEGG